MGPTILKQQIHEIITLEQWYRIAVSKLENLQSLKNNISRHPNFTSQNDVSFQMNHLRTKSIFLIIFPGFLFLNVQYWILIKKNFCEGLFQSN